MAEAYVIYDAVIQDPEDGEGYPIDASVFQASEATPPAGGTTHHIHLPLLGVG